MGGEPARHYAVVVPAEPDGLDHLHDLVDRARREWPALVDGELDRIEMAVIELAGNVARHGRPTGSEDMTLEIDVEDDAVRALLIDVGHRFEVDLASVTLPDDLDETGRGIFLARAAVDELAYDHRDGVNTWRIVQRRR